MGGIVSQTVYSLEDVRHIAGSRWCQEYYTKFMSVAVLQPVVGVDGSVAQQYRVGADFVNREIAIYMAEQDLQNWTKKNAVETQNYAGHSMCLFSAEEISNCTDIFCECKDAQTIKVEFCRSPVAQHLQEYLSSLPSYVNDCDMLDPDVYLFAVDPIEKCNEICKEHGSLFFDVDYPAGPQLAGPFAGTHGSKPPYNFANLRCFLRFGHVNPPPTCVFDVSTAHSIAETVVQIDTMCGNSEILAALGAVAGLYDGEYITTLISPSDKLSPYGLYSVKIRVNCSNPANDGIREMVDAWIIIDDFVPCDESGCMIFASSHKHHAQSAWSSLFEKAMTKLFGQNRGGYRETAHSPEYAGRLMELLTGVECKEYDVSKPKDWAKLQKLLSQGHDCRIAAATVTKKDLRKSKAHGIVTGVGVHGYTLLRTLEIKTKFKKPHKLLRLRNTWGRYEWQGDWSDGSAQFKEHQKLLETPGGDDGSFWISSADFAELFQGVYAITIPKDWANHTKRTEFLHEKADLRISHKFLDAEAEFSDKGDPGSVQPRFLDLVDQIKSKMGDDSTVDYTSPGVKGKAEADGDEAMNSVKPRSTKGPGGAAFGSIKLRPAASIKMSTKLSAKLEARISTKMSAKMSMKASRPASVDDDDFSPPGDDNLDGAFDYGAQGRRLPRRRRSTFVF